MIKQLLQNSRNHDIELLAKVAVDLNKIEQNFIRSKISETGYASFNQMKPIGQVDVEEHITKCLLKGAAEEADPLIDWIRDKQYTFNRTQADASTVKLWERIQSRIKESRRQGQAARRAQMLAVTEFLRSCGFSQCNAEFLFMHLHQGSIGRLVVMFLNKFAEQAQYALKSLKGYREVLIFQESSTRLKFRIVNYYNVMDLTTSHVNDCQVFLALNVTIDITQVAGLTDSVGMTMVKNAMLDLDAVYTAPKIYLSNGGFLPAVCQKIWPKQFSPVMVDFTAGVPLGDEVRLSEEHRQLFRIHEIKQQTLKLAVQSVDCGDLIRAMGDWPKNIICINKHRVSSKQMKKIREKNTSAARRILVLDLLRQYGCAESESGFVHTRVDQHVILRALEPLLAECLTFTNQCFVLTEVQSKRRILIQDHIKIIYHSRYCLKHVASEKVFPINVALRMIVSAAKSTNGGYEMQSMVLEHSADNKTLPNGGSFRILCHHLFSNFSFDRSQQDEFA